MPCLAPNRASPFEWDWCTTLGGVNQCGPLGGCIGRAVPCETKWACERRAVSPCWVPVRVCGTPWEHFTLLTSRGALSGGGTLLGDMWGLQ